MLVLVLICTLISTKTDGKYTIYGVIDQYNFWTKNTYMRCLKYV